jgi:hypothetical protein
MNKSKEIVPTMGCNKFGEMVFSPGALKYDRISFMKLLEKYANAKNRNVNLKYFIPLCELISYNSFVPK